MSGHEISETIVVCTFIVSVAAVIITLFITLGRSS